MQLDSEEKEVGTGLCLQHTTIDSQRDSQIEMRRMLVQIDVYNLKQKIDREIVRQRGGGGRYRQMYTIYNNRQRYLDREEEEVDTDRCIQHRTIDRQIERQYHRERRRRRQLHIDVYNIEQQIERQLDKEEQEVGTDRQNNTW